MHFGRNAVSVHVCVVRIDIHVHNTAHVHEISIGSVVLHGVHFECFAGSPCGLIAADLSLFTLLSSP